MTHLDLIDDNDRIANAAILLFGKKPQKYFIPSEVKCVQFYGNVVRKPMPAYQIYRGDVFELVDQATSFVMSRVDNWVGTRDEGETASVPTRPELPIDAVKEAIVNSILCKPLHNRLFVHTSRVVAADFVAEHGESVHGLLCLCTLSGSLLPISLRNRGEVCMICYVCAHFPGRCCRFCCGTWGKCAWFVVFVHTFRVVAADFAAEHGGSVHGMQERCILRGRETERLGGEKRKRARRVSWL